MKVKNSIYNFSSSKLCLISICLFENELKYQLLNNVNQFVPNTNYSNSIIYSIIQIFLLQGKYYHICYFKFMEN